MRPFLLIVVPAISLTSSSPQIKINNALFESYTIRASDNGSSLVVAISSLTTSSKSQLYQGASASSCTYAFSQVVEDSLAFSRVSAILTFSFLLPLLDSPADKGYSNSSWSVLQRFKQFRLSERSLSELSLSKSSRFLERPLLAFRSSFFDSRGLYSSSELSSLLSDGVSPNAFILGRPCLASMFFSYLLTKSDASRSNQISSVISNSRSSISFNPRFSVYSRRFYRFVNRSYASRSLS